MLPKHLLTITDPDETPFEIAEDYLYKTARTRHSVKR
jgi:hypothetical protein